MCIGVGDRRCQGLCVEMRMCMCVYRSGCVLTDHGGYERRTSRHCRSNNGRRKSERPNRKKKERCIVHFVRSPVGQKAREFTALDPCAHKHTDPANNAATSRCVLSAQHASMHLPLSAPYKSKRDFTQARHVLSGRRCIAEDKHNWTPLAVRVPSLPHALLGLPSRHTVMSSLLLRALLHRWSKTDKSMGLH